MVVPMNSVDLNNSAFLNLSSNPIVFATMVSIMCLYLVLCVWARKKDKLDEVKAGTTALLDNDPRDQYLYELVVWTGRRSGAGTTAKVRFIMSGEEAETESRLLWDDKRQVLQTSGVDSFVMAVPFPLGQLTHLRCVITGPFRLELLLIHVSEFSVCNFHIKLNIIFVLRSLF